MSDLLWPTVKRISDTDESWPSLSRVTKHSHPYLSLHIDTIADPDGDAFVRTVVQPNDAVAIVALDGDRVLLVRQYRHPQHAQVVEIPAGTCDVSGEGLLEAAQRELIEETNLRAASWEQLFTLRISPGYSTEKLTVFLATDVSAVDEVDRPDLHAEEAHLERFWMSLDDAVSAIMAGCITDAKTVAAILAVHSR